MANDKGILLRTLDEAPGQGALAGDFQAYVESAAGKSYRAPISRLLGSGDGAAVSPNQRRGGPFFVAYLTHAQAVTANESGLSSRDQLPGALLCIGATARVDRDPSGAPVIYEVVFDDRANPLVGLRAYFDGKFTAFPGPADGLVPVKWAVAGSAEAMAANVRRITSTITNWKLDETGKVEINGVDRFFSALATGQLPVPTAANLQPASWKQASPPQPDVNLPTNKQRGGTFAFTYLTAAAATADGRDFQGGLDQVPSELLCAGATAWVERATPRRWRLEFDSRTDRAAGLLGYIDGSFKPFPGQPDGLVPLKWVAEADAAALPARLTITPRPRTSTGALPWQTQITDIARARVSFFATIGGTTPQPLPAPVLTAGTPTASTIPLSWSAVASATGYRLERAPVGSNGIGAYATIYEDADTSYADSARPTSTTYAYRVVATGTVNSDPSNVVQATTTSGAPRILNASDYGVVADGTTDNANSFMALRADAV